MAGSHYKKSSIGNKKSSSKHVGQRHHISVDKHHKENSGKKAARSEIYDRKEKNHEKNSHILSDFHHKSHEKQNKTYEKLSVRKSSDDNAKRRKKEVSDESYEELSRKKKRLESELRALDMEEEEKTKSDGKKLHKKRDNEADEHPTYSNHKHKKRSSHKEKHNEDITQDNSRKKTKTVNIKEEPLLDDLNVKRSSNKEKYNKLSSRKDTKPDREVIVVKEELLDSDENSKRSSHREKRAKQSTKNNNSKNKVSKLSESDSGWGNLNDDIKDPGKQKEKPNFAVSGKLAEDTNTFNGVVIKYNEPSEARKPKRRWRLYPFKGDNDLPFIPIHRQSAYLFGRTRAIADIPIDHPSCSKQHAVLQFRIVSYKKDNGTSGRRVRPYIIDLESSNGTFVNNKRIDPRCYVELMERDVVKFGYSSREYVILHEESKNDEDDDVNSN